MRLYLDCADHKEWEKWAETGIFYGFTTNPTILKRDGIECTIPSMRKLTRHAFDLGMEELQLQAWGSTMPELYSCGLDLIELDSRVVVKIPMTMEGIKAARRLIDDGVSVTMTAVHSVHQAATGMALGAAYIAPYLGRMNDAGKNGYDDILKMQTIVAMSETLDETSSQTRLLVASIRSAEDISILAAGGCDTFTVSPLVANQLVSDPMTLEAAELFQEHALEMGAIRDQ
jgi:transaldolase